MRGGGNRFCAAQGPEEKLGKRGALRREKSVARRKTVSPNDLYFLAGNGPSTPMGDWEEHRVEHPVTRGRVGVRLLPTPSSPVGCGQDRVL